MDKHFKLHVRAFLADFFNFVQAEFTRQDDARDAYLLPKLHGGPIHSVGLYRQMNGHLGPLFSHHHDEAGVGHDQTIGLHGNDGLNVPHIGAHLVVMRQQVAGDEKLLAPRMRFGNADANLL